VTGNLPHSDKPQSDPPSEEEIRSRIGVAVSRLFARLGFEPNSAHLEVLSQANAALLPADQLPKAVEVAVRWAVGSATTHQVEQIKTREELDSILRTIGEATEVAPTEARAALKEFQRNFQRRGGPGAKPKLNDEDCVIVCKQILKFRMIDKFPLKKALIEVSKLCPILIGKKVGARTLEEKAWRHKDRYLREFFEQK
jgi:hypothetical protein